MRSAAFAHARMRAVSKPVLAARRSRPRGVLASSSSRSVVRIPSDFSCLSSSASRPSSWVIEYGITFSSLPGQWPDTAREPSIEHTDARSRARDRFDRMAPKRLGCIDIRDGSAGLGTVGRTTLFGVADAGDADAVDRNVRDRAFGAARRIFLAQEYLARESMMNADGHSCRRLLGAPCRPRDIQSTHASAPRQPRT